MKSILNYHHKKYPYASTQDFVKLLYQNTFGPGHFITNFDYIKKYLENEISTITTTNDNLYEHIGNNTIRVNLYPYINNFNVNQLLDYFYQSMSLYHKNENTIETFKQNLTLLHNDGFLNEYNLQDVHHSDKYRQIYNPHYRIINTSFLTLEMKIFQLQNYLDNINSFEIIALEGGCASGKSTIAQNLKDITIIDVDDFFLSKDKKTPERLSEIGGNIDYELYEECLKKIKPNCTITYKVFNCQTNSYCDKTITIKNKVLLVGVYSYHERVRKYITKLLVLLVDKNTQLGRLKERKLYDMFINVWLPLETIYYDSFDFVGNADLLI